MEEGLNGKLSKKSRNKTSLFGSPGRINHDSTPFYTSRLYEELPKEEIVKYTKIGHPAPFPVELPYRLIQLYTFEGEIVLDTFIGSGQTGIASKSKTPLCRI